MNFIRKNLVSVALLGLFAISISTLFQNCGKPLQVKVEESVLDNLSTNYLSYFNYSYEKAPNVYANLALIFPIENLGDFSQFTFYGVVAPADGSKGEISYTVAITDDAGNNVCTGDSGILNSGEENIHFQCLASSTLQKANITLVASYGGVSETFKASFFK